MNAAIGYLMDRVIASRGHSVVRAATPRSTARALCAATRPSRPHRREGAISHGETGCGMVKQYRPTLRQALEDRGLTPMATVGSGRQRCRVDATPAGTHIHSESNAATMLADLGP